MFRGFTKFNRSDYLKYKSENRIVPDGVNAKVTQRPACGCTNRTYWNFTVHARRPLFVLPNLHLDLDLFEEHFCWCIQWVYFLIVFSLSNLQISSCCLAASWVPWTTGKSSTWKCFSDECYCLNDCWQKWPLANSCVRLNSSFLFILPVILKLYWVYLIFYKPSWMEWVVFFVRISVPWWFVW